MKNRLSFFIIAAFITIMALLPNQGNFIFGRKSMPAYSAHTGIGMPFFHAKPIDMVIAPGGNSLLVISEEPFGIIEINTSHQTIRNLVRFEQRPTGAVLSARKQSLFVTLGGPSGKVAEVDILHHRVLNEFPTNGHTPVSPILSHDEKILYVCNRFNNQVVAIELETGRVVQHFQVVREPNSMVISKDGNSLFVGNFIPAGPSNAKRVHSEVSVIDLQNNSVENIQLPNGANSIRAIALSPDGKFVYVTHILARFQVPPTQIERGWINTNAISIINAKSRELVACVLLDDVDLGFSNPYAISCSSDGKLLLVTAYGGHELSIIDRIELHRMISETTSPKGHISTTVSDLANDLSFMHKLNRKRIRLPGYGPNSILIKDNDVYISEYFSGTLSLLSLDGASGKPIQQFALGDIAESADMVRYGEMLFNSADLCFQKWQSCESCHPDARVDGLNWDLLNDGIGNPKNTKSMLFAHKTPPSMSLGVRATAEDAVRAGLRFIQFMEVEEEKALAIDAYLKSLRPEPSPYLVNNDYSKRARRGKKLFEREGCITCHQPPLYTDLQSYHLDYVGSSMDEGKKFENPTLVEVWRTAPYLHDGSAITMDELIRIHNPYATGKLTKKERADLVEFVLSL